MTDRTLIIVPVLGRPHRVRPLIRSIDKATPEPHRILFVATDTDRPTIAAVRAEGADLLTVDEPGTYVRKVNAAYRASDEPLLFAAADDLRFHPGWLTAAADLLDDQVQVVGTNDLGNPRVQSGRHATHNLFTRHYIDTRSGVCDEPGLVMHEGYRHWYCDDEFVGTAQRRGVWAFCVDSVVEHLHPLFGKGDMDATYELGRQHNAADRSLSMRRRRLWKREARR